MGIGDWGLGIGDWGLGIGDWANPQYPIPNPQSPIPNPHFYYLKIFKSSKYIKISILIILIFYKFCLIKIITFTQIKNGHC